MFSVCRPHFGFAGLGFVFAIRSVSSLFGSLPLVRVFPRRPHSFPKALRGAPRTVLHHRPDDLDRQTYTAMFGNLADFNLLFDREQLDHP